MLPVPTNSGRIEIKNAVTGKVEGDASAEVTERGVNIEVPVSTGAFEAAFHQAEVTHAFSRQDRLARGFRLAATAQGRHRFN